VLPNLDSHTRADPVVKAIIAVVYTLFLIGTPIALVTYFNRAWRRVATVPNRTSYVKIGEKEKVPWAFTQNTFDRASLTFQ
jgi:hypothetical protein